jgi:hypothetical protein
MDVFLIDPLARTVSRATADGEDLLGGVSLLIEARALAVLPIAQAFALFVDSVGLLREGAGYWRWKDGEDRFAGKAVLTLIGENGLPAPIPEDFAAEGVAEGIVWCAPDELERIEQTLVAVTTPEGRFVPTIQRRPVWRAPVAPEPPPLWRIYETDTGRYRGVCSTGEIVTGLTVKAVREQLPPGLKRHPPEAEEEDDSIVEVWM